MSTRRVDLPEDTRLSNDTFIHFRGSHIPDGDQNKGVAFHTLLTAAAPSRLTYEKGIGNKKRGVFTQCLTSLLPSYDLHQMAYVDIVHMITSWLPQFVNITRMLVHRLSTCSIVRIRNVKESIKTAFSFNTILLVHGRARLT